MAQSATTYQNFNPIAVGDDDSDSDYSTGVSTETTTLSTSITRYQYENGRRYHAYKEGHYAFPNDEKEQDRLDLYHHIWRLRFKGETHLAPLPKDIQRVLDIGTGTGIWAIDFADEFEAAEIIGTDISPIQPKWVPPNVKFEVDDCEAEWSFPRDHFDYIHGRNLGGSITNWERLYQQVYEHLTPGGYIEMQDIDTRFYCDDGSLPPDDPIVLWQNLMNEAADKAGRIIAAGPLLKNHLLNAGFEGVTETVVKTPSGIWPAEDAEKEVGLYAREMMLEGLEGISVALFTRVLGWDIKDTLELVSKCKRTFQNKKVHVYTNWYIVYGRKPEQGKKVSAVMAS